MLLSSYFRSHLGLEVIFSKGKFRGIQAEEGAASQRMLERMSQCVWVARLDSLAQPAHPQLLTGCLMCAQQFSQFLEYLEKQGGAGQPKSRPWL